MGNVVQVDAAHGQHPQVLGHGNLADFRHAVAEIAVFERDEGVEAARLVLLAAQPVEVVDAVFDTLDMAVEDRGVGRDPQPVCSSMHLEPLYGRTFIGTDSGTQLLVENFGTPARYRLHPGAAEQTQPFVDSQPRFADHVGELDGSEGLDGRFGQDRLHAADHLDVIVQIVLGMYASDDMHFGQALSGMVAGDPLDLFQGVVPRLGTSLRTAVGTKITVEHAQVRGFDVEIAVEIDLVAAHALLAPGGQLAQQPKRSFVPEHEGFGRGDPLVGADLADDIFELRGHHFGALR